MSWAVVKLGSVCSLINGDRGKNYPSKDALLADGIPFINAGNLTDSHDIKCDGHNFISEERYDLLGNGKILMNDILFCLRGSLGKFAVVNEKYPKGAIASSLVIIRTGKKIDRDYFKNYLKSSLCNREIGKFENGAAQPNLSARDLKDFEIPLPYPNDPEKSLKEQQRIAAILDKADGIRRKRQQAIELADEFLRSVFLDMFGDPVTNPKGWEVKKFSDVGKLDRGKSKHRPRNDPSLLGGIHPLIQTGDVSNSGRYIKEFTSTYSDLGLAQSRKWPNGTLCITIAANIAKTGVLTFEACFPDSVVGFKANELTTVEYVQSWLGFLQQTLEASAPESAQKNINLAILRDLNIPIPPKDLQNKFSKLVKTFIADLEKTEVSSEELGKLFNSLSQKVFKGEL